MNKTKSNNNNSILESICDPIFFKTLFNNPYNQKWHKSYLEDYLNSIAYTTRSKGVEIKVNVSIDMRKKTKVNASLYIYIDNYQKNKSIFFSSDISFSITKKNYHNDFINRLGLKDIEMHVSNILKEQEKINKTEEALSLKKEILKRYLPFQDSYNYTDKLTAYLNEKSVEISHIGSERPFLKVTGNIDFLMRICAFIRDNQE